MKSYMITVSHPACADVVLDAETKEEAIAKIKDMLNGGTGLDFEVDVDDPDDAEIYAEELPPERRESESHEASKLPLRDFTVLMKAISHKEVPLKAVFAEAAVQLAQEMYFHTDTLDFMDADVDFFSASALEEENDAEEDEEDEEKECHEFRRDGVMFATLLRLVELVRTHDAIPDRIMAAMLMEVFSGVSDVLD